MSFLLLAVMKMETASDMLLSGTRNRSDVLSRVKPAQPEFLAKLRAGTRTVSRARRHRFPIRTDFYRLEGTS